MEQLKPCPFCGGKAKIIYPGGRKLVKCGGCGVTTSALEQYPEKHWNTRIGEKK